MKKVTYGVVGLIDWKAKIPVGRARISVHFTGGALTKYGVTPAEFTTANPMMQRIIEDSAYYRSGRITVLRTVGEADVIKQLKTIEVACIEDAIDYMREHYNVPAVKIRNMQSLQNVASKYQITFKITSDPQ